MLIDLSRCTASRSTPSAGRARPGRRALGRVDRETQAFGLAAPGGVVSDTGVAGLTLGGGYGWLRRKYGLACDNLVAAQVVCADGEVRTASSEHEPGPVLGDPRRRRQLRHRHSFTFRLHPVGPIVAFAGVFYPVEAAPEVLSGYRDVLRRCARRGHRRGVTITMPAGPEPPGAGSRSPLLVVGAVYAGDHEEGMGVLQPLRELAAPLADISQPMPFTAVQSAFDGFFPRGQIRAYWKARTSRL